MFFESDTIAAISTSTMGNGGIGIVRISGSEAFDIAGRLFFDASGNQPDLNSYSTRTMHYGRLVWDGKLIDEVLVSVMKAPGSYTCEDVVEINCHGGLLVTKKVLEAVILAGARLAEPGEFTKRAFLNGRIDLAQAESVIDIINSKNTYALDASEQQLSGKLSKSVESMRQKLLSHMAFIEAALDDPEHYDLTGYGKKMLPDVESLTTEIEHLLKTFDDGRFIREGINTVILGRTNAGKSSLLNALSGSDRAIVTEVEGTTRDVLEQTINLSDITLNLIDTAGIRSTEDIVEKIGIDRAVEVARKADLILYVVDVTKKPDENDRKIIDIIKNRRAIILLNKCDLEESVSGAFEKEGETVISDAFINDGNVKCSGAFINDGNVKFSDIFTNEADILELLKASLDEKISGKDDITNGDNVRIIRISAKKETGMELLASTIRDMFFSGEIGFNDQVYVTNIRQKIMLKETQKSLKLVRVGIEDGMPEDCIVIDLMNAYESLGKIVGETVEDDLINQVFERFCMGK